MPTTPELAGQLFRGTVAIRRGLLTKAQLKGPGWRRIRQDVYADVGLVRDHELACRAVRLRLPAGTIFAGPSAAYLHGISHAAAYTDEVHVITPPAVRLGVQLNLRVHHLELSPSEILTGPGLPRTTAARTAWDLAAWLDLVDSVPIVDTMLGRRLVSTTELSDLVSRNVGRRGWRRARQAFALADSGAQSRPESVLRVRLALAGLPTPVTQCAIPVTSELVLHVDLAWEEWQVAVEYDGHWHADPNQLHHDRKRLNKLVLAGWTVLHVTSQRLYNDFPNVAKEVKSALYARGWRP